MPSNDKKGGSWLGHPLLSHGDAHDLHLAAALYEFQRGKPRQEAEKMALDDYRREHHARAAAHHFAGLKAGQATGNTDDAKRHYALYALHVKSLGEDPVGPVPDVIRKYGAEVGKSAQQKHVYRFRGHGADQFLVQPIAKSDVDTADRSNSLRDAVNKCIAGISLGPIVDEIVEYLSDVGGIPKAKAPEPKAEPEPKKVEAPKLVEAVKKILEQVQFHSSLKG
jgi:hypothetical protein